ncbi:MAG: hypothetical protein WC407_13845 [Sulfuricurvum sp.]
MSDREINGMHPACFVKKMIHEEAQTATLRDQFAMAALRGIISNKYWDYDIERAVKLAYEIADAMLAARKQNGNEKEND